MADPNYRDPKVTKAGAGGSNLGRIIGIALAALVALLVLAWLFGLFGGDDEVDAVVVPTEEVEPVEDDAVVVPAD